MSIGRAHAMHNLSSASFWMECDHWYQHKSRQIAAGEYVDSESDASRRGTALHDLLEIAVGLWLHEDPSLDDMIMRAFEVRAVQLGWSDAESDENWDQLKIAFQAVRKLLDQMPEAQVALELAVPLSHEPESVGYVDLAIVDGHDVFIVDHKFGQVEVDPGSYQNRGYALNAIRFLREKGIEIPDGARVHLGINQPRHAHEIRFAPPTNEKELWRFETAVLERVKRQKSGKGLQAPASLETCQWCDFGRICSAKRVLVSGMLSTVEELADRMGATGGRHLSESGADPALAEQLVRQKSIINEILKEATEWVQQDEATFPHWRRTQVNNPRVWDMRIRDLNEIVRELRSVGVQNPMKLMSPSEVEKTFDSPAVKEMVGELSLSEGFHVRLKYQPPAAAAPAEGKAAEVSPTDGSREVDAPVRRPPPPTFIARVQAAMNRPGAMDDAVADGVPASIEDEIEPPAKPKRKRRTKAEMLEDATQAVAETDPSPVPPPRARKKTKPKSPETLEKAKQEVRARASAIAKKGKK